MENHLGFLTSWKLHDAFQENTEIMIVSSSATLCGVCCASCS